MMTNMSNVAKKIIEDANLEKEQIIESAKAKAAQIIADANDDLKSALKEAEKKAQLKKKEVFNAQILKIHSAKSQEILNKKLQAIDSILEDIGQSLKNPEKKQYKVFIDKIMGIIDIDKGEVIIGAKEKTIKAKDIIDAAKKHKIALKQSKEKADFEYGAKLISGKARYDVSPYDYFMSSYDEMRIELAKILFPEEA